MAAGVGLAGVEAPGFDGVFDDGVVELPIAAFEGEVVAVEHRERQHHV
jgi:hypothetical protein